MRILLEALRSFLMSPAFDRATHRAGAYLLLFSNLCLPLGLHRLWMRLPGWWWFPVTFVVAGVGTWNYVNSRAAAWQIFILFYPLLLIADFWVLAIAPVPPKKAGK